MSDTENLTRRQLLRSAGGLALVPLPAWGQTQSVAKQDRAKKRCDLAVIGHLGHGKTTLTAAITKVLAQRNRATFSPYDKLHLAPNESAYGSSFAIARVQYESDRRRYGQIDCPNHADYVKAMITGAAPIDGAILVVSAQDGPMPQTREHILLAREVGVPYIVVFLNKVDVVDDRELLNLVELEVRELLSKYNFPGDKVPLIKGSALMALEDKNPKLGRQSILELVKAVDNYVPQPPTPKDGPFLMPIRQVSPIGARTTGIIGHIERGIVRAGDEVEIVGLDVTQKKRVAEVQLLNVPAGQGEAGQDVLCILKETTSNSVRAGQVLSKPGSIKPHTKFKAEAYILTKEEGGRHTPFFNKYRPQFYFRTGDVTGQCTLPAGTEMIMPGDNATMDVELITPIAMEKKLRFAMREGNLTVAAGVVSTIIE